jgi:hypothetical protein
VFMVEGVVCRVQGLMSGAELLIVHCFSVLGVGLFSVYYFSVLV